MPHRSRISAVAIYAATVLFASVVLAHRAAGADAAQLMVFVEPGVDDDPIFMALAKDLYKTEGLYVETRLFPSGTTALQTFKAGAGDIVVTGDLPGLQYWQRGAPYRVITALERDAKGYAAIVSNAVKSPQDLVGKSVATRVGSTGSYFLSQYLRKNGIDEAKVHVRNLDPPTMPPALCRGDIDGFFVWEPGPSEAQGMCAANVHYLTTAEGYMVGYNIIGARPEWLATPEGADKARRFLRATLKGAEIAATDAKADIDDLEKRFGLSEKEIVTQRAIMERDLKLDAQFYSDFCSENEWQERAGLQTGPSDLAKWVWPDGLKSIDPSLVAPPPPPC